MLVPLRFSDILDVLVVGWILVKAQIAVNDCLTYSVSILFVVGFGI